MSPKGGGSKMAYEFARYFPTFTTVEKANFVKVPFLKDVSSKIAIFALKIIPKLNIEHPKSFKNQSYL